MNEQLKRRPFTLYDRDTFSSYLARHHLHIVDAARIAALPAALVWRATRWLAISDGKARALVEALRLATGEAFRGCLVIAPDDTRLQARRYF